MRILLVEDTVDVGEAIVARFERIGHTVDWEKDGSVADEVLEVQAYDLLILDVNLPALDGFSILKRLRQRKSKTPSSSSRRDHRSTTVSMLSILVRTITW